MINNFPVSEIDITNADIFVWPDAATLKGKTVSWYSEAAMMEYVNILPEIIIMNKNITLAADIMSVNGLSLMISISRRIKMMTVEQKQEKTCVVTDRDENEFVTINVHDKGGRLWRIT